MQLLLNNVFEEEYAIVGQRDFTWLRIIAATHQSHLRYSMMRRTEGALRDKAGIARQLAGHGVNLRGLQTLCQRQGGRMEGRRLAIIDLPLPGGPTMMRL